MAIKKTATNLQDATTFAIEISKSDTKESYIVLSKGFYYIEDELPMVRVWEELVATYKNGELIK